MLRRSAAGTACYRLRLAWGRGGVAKLGLRRAVRAHWRLWFVFRSWYPLFLFVKLRFKTTLFHMTVRKNRISRWKIVFFTLQVFIWLKSALIFHLQSKWQNDCILQGFLVILTYSFAWLLIHEAEKIIAKHSHVRAKCKHYAGYNSKTVNLTDLKMSQACSAVLITPWTNFRQNLRCEGARHLSICRGTPQGVTISDESLWAHWTASTDPVEN